ncbi:sensor histidine kinase [Roseivirga echinicomitans]
MNKSTLYWLCQFFGWGIYILFSIGMMYVFAGIQNMNLDSLLLQLIIGACLLIFSHFFRWYIKKNGWAQLSLKSLVPKLILGVIFVSFLSQSFIHFLIYFVLPLKGIIPFNWINFIGYVGSVSIVMASWSTLYFAYQSIQRNRRGEIEKLELTTALQEAELAILKNQINPHFLFNALNNIRSLILSDPEQARNMVTHISELLRYSIQFNASEKVTLGQEIAIVKDYLQLESIQFANRLSYSFEIDDKSLDIKIPPMAIQLLVENAIKHGVSQMTAGGNILIKSVLENDHLRIEVCNNGQLKEKSKREGIGLKNLIERLKILFGHFAELKVENSSENTVTASLKIPLS